jgi:hypothetical protein
MNKGKMKSAVKIFSVLFLFIPLLNSCAVSPNPACVKENSTYCKPRGNFTGQWYDFYERALSCMEGKCYQAALSDLDETIKRRFEDQRMVRTFGMHFTDYFPHREKGIVYYLMGNDPQAKTELELSVQQYPSEKAFFYLDKVRTRLMEKENRPVSLPILIFESDEIWTKADPVIVSGIAQDKQYLSEITLKDKQVFMESSAQQVSFREEFRLPRGRHEINVRAKNIRGGFSERRIIVYVDRSGPAIILTAVDPGFEIQGTLYDESGEIFLEADGTPIPVPKGVQTPFSVPLKIGTDAVALLAKDRLGNETKAVITRDMLNAEDNDEKLYLLASLMSDASAVRRPQSNAPEIILKNCADQQTVFQERIELNGQVTGENIIESLTVNDVPVPGSGGRVIFFNYTPILKIGQNTVTIKTADELGNTSIKEIRIFREIPEILKPKYRYSLSMHPFEEMTGNEHGSRERRIFQSLFLKHLLDRSRFQLMMREESDAAFSGSPEGKTPDATLLGSIYETGNGIEIASRLVDIRTGEILAIKDVYSETSGKSALDAAAQKLSEKFHRAFPLMDAGIVQIAKESFTVVPEKWIPGKGKIKMKWPLIVYRQKSDADAGVIGNARIEGISDENYQASPLNAQEIEFIKEGDRVITR